MNCTISTSSIRARQRWAMLIVVFALALPFAI